MPGHLFVYGTLHPERAPASIRATARLLVPVGLATVQGTLVDLGAYPGLLVPGPAPRAVAGEVFFVPDEEVLARLDAYEDFRDDDPESSLFLRVELDVEMTDGALLRCWVYTYNRPIANCSQ